MGLDYAIVHLKYTIPPAIALTLLYRPLLNRIDLYKLAFLITIAVVATIPWDSYLIHRRIWTYPPSVIIGPKLFGIPAEEVFFFVIQTYNTSFVYLLLSKPIFHPSYLPKSKDSGVRKVAGQVVLTACVLLGCVLIYDGREGTYLGLILAWAGPFALLLWSLSGHFLVALPLTSTLLPVMLPTVYLWMVDTFALRRGTWSIEHGTKLGIHLWDGLEIEEAAFFLATNTLIVLGLVTFDNSLAVMLTFPDLFPTVPELPSPMLKMKALLVPVDQYDQSRLEGIDQAVARLKAKSRSFYLASSTFQGRLRIDLIILYSFCRVADDLIDNATTEPEAREWVKKLTHFLDLAYESKEARIVSREPDIHAYIKANFPESAQSALRLLPTHILSYGPFYDLLEGFKTDLDFLQTDTSKSNFPIATEYDLETYAFRVAGTVAELCLELVYHHSHEPCTAAKRERLVRAGGRMGIALQCVNIARDIATDAAIGRVYLPTSWLKEAGLTPEDVLEQSGGAKIEKIRERLLAKAFGIYREAHPALGQLPADSSAPMRVAIESYMEIGRVLGEKGYTVKRGRATVPKLRRLKVAWRALNE